MRIELQNWNREQRTELVAAMHRDMCNVNDEDVQDIWFQHGIPDDRPDGPAFGEYSAVKSDFKELVYLYNHIQDNCDCRFARSYMSAVEALLKS